MKNKIALIAAFFAFSILSIGSEGPIIDSKYTLSEALKGSKAPQEILDKMCLLDVTYYSTDGKLHRGQFVVAKDVKSDIEKVFETILKEKFPVEKCIPIVKYGWSDAKSMADNNSSSFCYRTIAGTKKISMHAKGRAIDINPKFNPCIEDGSISPKDGKYNVSRAGTFHHNSPIYKKFIELGWGWGGNYKSLKDYHHFYKNEEKK